MPDVPALGLHQQTDPAAVVVQVSCDHDGHRIAWGAGPVSRKPRLKFLCVCQGGNVRSAALKNILNYNFHQDALACSAEKNSRATLAHLVAWADVVVLMSGEVRDRWWPKALRDDPKVCLVDVGPDRFGTPFHPELNAFLFGVVATWKARAWDVHGRPGPDKETA